MIFQTGWYTSQQMMNINKQYSMNPSSVAKIVFGDNMEDKFRKSGTKRSQTSGQSADCYG